MTYHSTPLRIAIAGLGTVGGTTLHLLQKHAEIYAARCKRPVQVVAVSARDKTKHADKALEGIRWENDPIALATADDVDLVVETIGGSEGTAKALVESALASGKNVVTANKALLAEHGMALAQLAEKHNVTLAYEAAVAGGIPIVKTLREGLAANEVKKVVGILNGTSNFILSHMQDLGSDFEEALEEASRLGYAEADPSFDIDGIDAAQKLSLITSLAFGCRPNYQKIYVEGIRHINKLDMYSAAELGYNIKLLGITHRTANGAIEQRVHPCMLPANSPVGVDDVYNAIVVEGDAVGRLMIEGRGAGGGPTASSIIADICDIARGVSYPVFTVAQSDLKDASFVPMEQLRSAYYMRLAVQDETGVVSDVTRILGDEGISLRSFIQHSHQPEEAVQLLLTTHVTIEAAMNHAIERLANLPAVTQPPTIIRIEEFEE